MFGDEDDILYVDEDHERQVLAERRARAVGGLVALAVVFVLLLVLALVEALATS